MIFLECRTNGSATKPFRVALVVAGLVAAFSLSGCDELFGPPKVHPSVSEAPIVLGEPFSAVIPPGRMEIYYGEGDCAPRYPNGMQGTCINNRPCNGFGFKDDQGQWQCACFATKGGCKAGSICSMRARGCTGANDADFKRSP